MSDHERLINPPQNARMLAIPQEYLAICQVNRTRKRTDKETGQPVIDTYSETDECAAALLYNLERFVIWKIKTYPKCTTTENTWVDNSQAWLEQWELMGAFSEHRVREGLKFLLKQGFIQRGRSTRQEKRTFKYRFMKDKVQAAVSKLGAMLNIEQYKATLRSKEGDILVDESIKVDEVTHSPTHGPTQSDSPAQEAAPDAPRFAVGQRVYYPGDDAYGVVVDVNHEDRNGVTIWNCFVRWEDGTGTNWTPGEALRLAPADPPTPPKRGRAPDLLFEAVAAAFKYERMNDSERGQVNKACKLLRQSQVTPGEVPSLYAWCVAQNWPGAFTPLAMAKHVNDWRNSQKSGVFINTNGMSIGGSLPIVRAPAEVCA